MQIKIGQTQYNIRPGSPTWWAATMGKWIMYFVIGFAIVAIIALLSAEWTCFNWWVIP